MNYIFKKRIEEARKILWTEILNQIIHDEIIYKLTLKFLRQDNYDIGNSKIPKVKKIIL